MYFEAKRFQLVELVIGIATTGAQSKVNFQNQPQLQSISGTRQVFVEAIETYTNEDLSTSPLTNGNAVATPAQLQNAVLTLSVDTNLNFDSIPLASLHRINRSNAGTSAPHVRDLFMVNQIWQIDWTKSFVTMPAAPAGQPYSYLFGVYYRYSTDEQPISQQALFTEIMQLKNQVYDLRAQLRL